MESLATALPALGEAFALIVQPQQLLFLALGVLLGLSVGVFPGLGGIAGLSLVLPFIYGMDPVSGLALMVGLVAVIPTADTFASVLMGIPGSSASQATVLDGFPLSRQGQAARALSAAFVSSLFGGLLGACVLVVLVFVARPIVLAFGLPELLMITLFGLSMVAVLAGRIPLKGLVAAALGLLVGSVGAADATGSARMSTIEWTYLYDGFQLVIVGLGIFAIPEIVALLRQDTAISRNASLGAGWWDGIRDWWDNIFLSARCAVIGVVVGIIPGLGGSVVDWIAYGHTVQSTKDKNARFGEGDIRGVIGPESSNNAKEGGGLVPTLVFGIPGSGSMAIFIGGLSLLGYEAGPQMLTTDLALTYTTVWSLALANVLGAGLCILLSGWIARLTTIRFTLLAPFLLTLIVFAAFQARQSLGDLFALLGFGLLGIFLRRFEWSRPAFLIGFVLSTQAENYSFQAWQVATFKFEQAAGTGLAYVFSPIVLVLLALTLVSLWFGTSQGKKLHGEKKTLSQSRQGQSNLAPKGQSSLAPKFASSVFLLIVTLYVVVSLVDALTIEQMIDKIFPATVATVASLACFALIVKAVVTPEGDPMFADKERVEKSAPYSLWNGLGWLTGLVAFSALVGFIVALACFLLLFLRLRANISWSKTLFLSAVGMGFIVMAGGVLHRNFPPGLLQEFFDLPWPLT